MSSLGSSRAPNRDACLVFGSNCRDIAVKADDVELAPGVVRFRLGRDWYEVPYAGQSIEWGDKRIATTELSWIKQLPNSAVIPGGGAWASGVQLATLVRRRRVAAEVLLMDAASGCPESRREPGIEYLPLGIEALPINLVLTLAGGAANRIILKSPTVPGTLPWRRRRLLLRDLGHRAGVVLINSPKPRDLAAVATSIARSAGVMQFSVLTESLAPLDRVALLLARVTGSKSIISSEHPEVLDPAWQQDRLDEARSVFGVDRVLEGQEGFTSLARPHEVVWQEGTKS